MIRNSEKFQPKASYHDLGMIDDQLPILRREKNFRAALARYAALDEKLLSFEQSTTRAYHEMEWEAERQGDIERGA
jgi:hypothetical protein